MHLLFYAIDLKRQTKVGINEQRRLRASFSLVVPGFLVGSRVLFLLNRESHFISLHPCQASINDEHEEEQVNPAPPPGRVLRHKEQLNTFNVVMDAVRSKCILAKAFKHCRTIFHDVTNDHENTQ
jgi:hypothetical protein